MTARTAQTIGPVQRLLHLKRSEALGGLGTAELSVIAEHAQERTFRKGQLLLQEGEPTAAMHVVVDGHVHVSRKGRLLGHGGPGAIVGGYAAFARDDTGVGAIAESDTLTLALDAETMLEIFEDHFAVLHHVLKLVCSQLVDVLAERPGELQRAMPGVRPAEQAPRELDLVQRIFYLRRVPVFARSSINALSELSRNLQEVAFEPGTELWRIGEPANTLLMIISGLALCETADGVLLVAGPGSPLGALDAVAGRPRFFSARAETRVVALQGTAETLVDVLEDNFEMGMDYLALMARWLLDVHERAASEGQGAEGRMYGCEAPPAMIPAT